MAWAKLDDKFPRNPKVVKAGPLAAYLYVCSLCYCNEYLTDGLIADEALTHIAPGVDNVKRRAAKLVEVGLWRRTNGGFVIPNYADHNFTAEQVRDRRAATAARVAKWQRRREGNPR
jgi:hypothetical protein